MRRNQLVAAQDNDGVRIKSLGPQTRRARTRRRDLQQPRLKAPFYVGLIVSLAVLLFKLLHLLYEFITHAWRASESDVIVGVLSLIDVSLTASLVPIVVFLGYENFVSRIDPAGHPDWPAWMARIDFAGLKQKALASIVANSAIQVARVRHAAFSRPGSAQGSVGEVVRRSTFRSANGKNSRLSGSVQNDFLILATAIAPEK